MRRRFMRCGQLYSEFSERSLIVSSYHSIAVSDYSGTAPVRVQHCSSYWQSEMRIGEARKPGPPGDIDDPNAASDADELGSVGVESGHGPFSQPEVELSVSVNDALSRSLEQRSFVRASAFRGARPGAVFKTGEHGLGYYIDACSEVGDAGVPIAAAETGQKIPPVVIALSDLLCLAVEVALPSRARRRMLRVRTRARGRRAVKVTWDGPHVETLAACTRFHDAGLCAFDTFNPNCGNRALDYLSVTAADACFFQEMKCRGADLDQQARTAAGQGWQLAGGPARVTDRNGVSSGVAVAVRGHLGVAQPLRPMDHQADVTRFCIRWLGSVCRGGIHLISIYLRDA